MHHNENAAALRRHLCALAARPDEVMTLPGWSVTMLPGAARRMRQVLRDTGAALVYGDCWLRQSDGSLRMAKSEEWQPGALREGFDMGPVWMVSPVAMESALGTFGHEYTYGMLYALRLALQRQGPVVRLGEPLCIAERVETAADQWAYVDPANRERQIELEDICSAHLKAVGAYLEGEPARVDRTNTDEEEWSVEASVVIPVRNRVATIGDAVRSALSQDTDFSYNVIVVDNHSDDGTTELLDSLAAGDSRLVHVVPDEEGLGIGGCWNTAILHPACGRYAVQLDSDDIYSSSDTLRRVVDTFRRERCAMVVGSYTLTDIDGNTIPPGLIDHREWTRLNGRNNLLRVNGIGAPRAFVTSIARDLLFPNSSYGEDYAMALAISRRWHVGRIFDSIYMCRRWSGNSDASLSPERLREFNHYKDSLRTMEIVARRALNRD
ncbi:MAG: glycosyltransferase [Muribaculum intestinale]|nr:glycosyltransferase [Muribaculum intestinale]